MQRLQGFRCEPYADVLLSVWMEVKTGPAPQSYPASSRAPFGYRVRRIPACRLRAGFPPFWQRNIVLPKIKLLAMRP